MCIYFLPGGEESVTAALSIPVLLSFLGTLGHDSLVLGHKFFTWAFHLPLPGLFLLTILKHESPFVAWNAWACISAHGVYIVWRLLEV